MTTQMHSVLRRYIDALCTPGQKARFYADVVGGGKLFGSWGGEPERRGITRNVAHSGQRRLRGRRRKALLREGGRRPNSTIDGYEPADGQDLALVPHDAPGLEITGG